jgi:hypothetical protein
MFDLEQLLAGFSWKILSVASLLLILLAGISLANKKLKPVTKTILFFSIVATVILPTVYLAASTIYLNNISSSKGPVHWHADFEIWTCGQEIELKDPVGLSNKLGTPTLHEHNDKRIHLEGVVVKPEDASVGRFFQVIGGSLTPTSFTIPTNAGELSWHNGMLCNGQEAQVQVFVYKTDSQKYYYQQKLENPQSYIISPQSNVPPGDCIIVEFDIPKERTQQLCRSYKVAQQIGKLKGEKTVYGN